MKENDRKATGRMLLEVAISLCILLGLTFIMKLSPVIAGIIAVACYFGFDLLLSPQVRIHLQGPMAKQRAAQYEELLSGAQEKLEHIDQTKVRLKDAALRRDVNELLEKLQKVMGYLAQKPSRIPKARKLLTYYLDTVVAILTKACEVQDQPGETAQEILAKAQNALYTLGRSVDGQMDHLLQSDAMDLEAEIDVMRQMMLMDGLDAPAEKEHKE